MLKPRGLGGANFASMDLGGKVFDRLKVRKNAVANVGTGGNVWVAQPVMADHAIFVGVGDRPSFKGGHIRKCLAKARLHGGDKGIVKAHAADV